VTRIVIDASVALKWVVAESGTPAALRLRKATALAAPDLLMAECANILWKKVQRGELVADEAVIAARLLARADIEIWPMGQLLEPATRMAIALDHPAYDCVYLALAAARDWRFVTADNRLLRKLREQAEQSLAALALSLEEAVAGLG
jgi:predicted nucleic acid-binding protein